MQNKLHSITWQFWFKYFPLTIGNFDFTFLISTPILRIRVQRIAAINTCFVSVLKREQSQVETMLLALSSEFWQF